MTSDCLQKETNMSNTMEEGSYEQCLVKTEKCKWYEYKTFQYVIVATGLPCTIVALYVLMATALIGLGLGVAIPPRDSSVGIPGNKLRVSRNHTFGFPCGLIPSSGVSPAFEGE